MQHLVMTQIPDKEELLAEVGPSSHEDHIARANHFCSRRHRSMSSLANSGTAAARHENIRC